MNLSLQLLINCKRTIGNSTEGRVECFKIGVFTLKEGDGKKLLNRGKVMLAPMANIRVGPLKAIA